MNKTLIGLVFILVLATFFRLFQLGSVPAVLNRDEAALAYNAFLLKETGTDEWQVTWPLFLKSFGDYKLIGYPLALIPLLTVFPFQDWAVRLPSAIAGILLCALAFLWIKKWGYSRDWALLGSLLIAVQPVFIFYSRVAFEANVALTFLVAGLVLFLFNKKILDIFALVLISCAALTYNTPFLLLPFLMPFVFFLRSPLVPKSWIVPIIGLLLIGVVLGSQLLLLTTQKGSITLFSDETTWMEWIEYRTSLSGWQQTTFGSKYIFIGNKIFSRLLASFSPHFLVTAGGTHPWHTLPGFGHLLAATVALSFIGVASFLYDLIKEVKNKDFANVLQRQKHPLLLLYLSFVSLLPAVITVDAPHATRSLLFFFCLSVWAVMGSKLLFELPFFKKIPRMILMVLFFIIIGIEFTHFAKEYFNWTVQEQAAWRPGIKTALKQVDRQNLTAWVDEDGYSYILVAWYEKMPSDLFFSTLVHQQANSYGFFYGERIGKYHFIVSQHDRKDEKNLVLWNDQNNTWEVQAY